MSPAEDVKGGCRRRAGLSPIGLPTTLPVPWAGRCVPFPSAAWADLVCAAEGMAAQLFAVDEGPAVVESEPDTLDFACVEQGCGDAERAVSRLAECGISNPTVFRTVFMPEAAGILRKRLHALKHVAEALLIEVALDGARVDEIFFREVEE